MTNSYPIEPTTVRPVVYIILQQLVHSLLALKLLCKWAGAGTQLVVGWDRAEPQLLGWDRAGPQLLGWDRLQLVGWDRAGPQVVCMAAGWVCMGEEL